MYQYTYVFHICKKKKKKKTPHESIFFEYFWGEIMSNFVFFVRNSFSNDFSLDKTFPLYLTMILA